MDETPAHPRMTPEEFLTERTCEVDGCEKVVHSKGMCQMHYCRMKRHGDVSTVLREKRSCGIEDCGKEHYAHGLCHTHYMRKKRTGSASPEKPVTLIAATAEESFMARTKQEGDCLLWIGGRTEGYGRMSVNGREMFAHRYAWERANGTIPDGMFIDHKCWNRACVNVNHLRLATPAENTQYRSEVRNSLGVKNVRRSGRGYKVGIVKEGKYHYFGTFDTLEEASEVAESKRRELHGEFAGTHSRLAITAALGGGEG